MCRLAGRSCPGSVTQAPVYTQDERFAVRFVTNGSQSAL